MRQNRIQNVERVGVFAHKVRHAVAHHDKCDLRLALEEEAAFAFLLRLHRGDRFRFRSTRNRFEQLFDRGEQAVGFDVAHHDEGRIIGRIIGVVMPLQVVQGHCIQVVEPADHRPMVGMAEIGLGEEGFDECALRVILRAQASFFFHDFSFRRQLLHVEHEPLHPVGFHLQGQLDAVCREIFEVGGEVLAREGVVDSAVLANKAGEGALGIFHGALEHHMFQHVGEACPAHDFVARADLVPDLDGGHRRFGHFDQQDFHPVGQDEFTGFCRRGGRGEGEEETACGNQKK